MDKDIIEEFVAKQRAELSTYLKSLGLNYKAIKIVCDVMQDYTFEDPNDPDAEGYDWEEVLEKHDLIQPSIKADTLVMHIMQYLDFHELGAASLEKHQEFMREAAPDFFSETGHTIRNEFFGATQDQAFIGANIAEAVLRFNFGTISDEPETDAPYSPPQPR